MRVKSFRMTAEKVGGMFGGPPRMMWAVYADDRLEPVAHLLNDGGNSMWRIYRAELQSSEPVRSRYRYSNDMKFRTAESAFEMVKVLYATGRFKYPPAESIESAFK